MEWSYWQPISFLFECIPCGVLLGFLFEITSGFVHCSSKKVIRYVWDGIYGVLAAVITFFCALVIMDGQLHPVLLMGLLFGFLIEHFSVGRLLKRGMVLVVYSFRYLKALIKGFWHLIFTALLRKFAEFHRFFLAKIKNNENNS